MFGFLAKIVVSLHIPRTDLARKSQLMTYEFIKSTFLLNFTKYQTYFVETIFSTTAFSEKKFFLGQGPNQYFLAE